jgi:methylated-DNA-[protein]-cysteine S-methyltransferase
VINSIVHDFGFCSLSITEENDEIIGISFSGDGAARPDAALSPALRIAITQLGEYFDGGRQCFDLKLRLRGSDFQRSVWNALLAIPFGETRTYKDIALKIGNPNAARAAGGACNKNPIAIVVPCHRVVGTNGNLTGYAGGLNVKRRLLDLEFGLKE